MELLLLPWMSNNRKRHGSLEVSEIPVFKKPSLPKKSQFKLISFCQRDLAEPCRLIFAYANIPYENLTCGDFKEFLKNNPGISPKMAGPMLEWNGKVVHGNNAIARMLAKMYGLAGMGIFEQAQADTITGIVHNMSQAAAQYMKGAFGFEVTDMEKCYKEVFEPSVKKHFEMLENYASQGPIDGFFFSSGVTYADFCVANVYELIASMHPELLINYKNVALITERVLALPQLQQYLLRRPSMKEVMNDNIKIAKEQKWTLQQIRDDMTQTNVPAPKKNDTQYTA